MFSYARGFAPCIPGTEPEAALGQGANHAPGGGVPSLLPADLAAVMPGGVVRLLCRLSTLPSAYVFSPIPPPPFPSGEGGDFLFSYARGFAPCIPRAEPERHLHN